MHFRGSILFGPPSAALRLLAGFVKRRHIARPGPSDHHSAPRSRRTRRPCGTGILEEPSSCFQFRHPLDASNKNYPVLLSNGTISDRTVNFNPFDLEAAHIFKIFGGKRHENEAMGFTLPLYSKNGWSPFIK
jgi:hypothetical protein